MSFGAVDAAEGERCEARRRCSVGEEVRQVVRPLRDLFEHMRKMRFIETADRSPGSGVMIGIVEVLPADRIVVVIDLLKTCSCLGVMDSRMEEFSAAVENIERFDA